MSARPMSRNMMGWLKQQPTLGMLKHWPISRSAAIAQRRQRAYLARTGPPKPPKPRMSRSSTSCPQGHLLSEDNVQWIYRKGRSYRICRACRNQYQRDWRRRARAQARQQRLEIVGTA